MLKLNKSKQRYMAAFKYIRQEPFKEDRAAGGAHQFEFILSGNFAKTDYNVEGHYPNSLRWERKADAGVRKLQTWRIRGWEPTEL